MNDRLTQSRKVKIVRVNGECIIANSLSDNRRSVAGAAHCWPAAYLLQHSRGEKQAMKDRVWKHGKP